MSDVTIVIRPMGPYIVKGPVTLRDFEGNEIAAKGGENIALCRCGASATKPFCDKSHSRIGFMAAAAAVQDAGKT